MSFSPSTRGEAEWTPTSKVSAVNGGTGGGGVSAAPPPPQTTTVTAANVSNRPCGSPLLSPRTTVQRVGGTSNNNTSNSINTHNSNGNGNSSIPVSRNCVGNGASSSTVTSAEGRSAPVPAGLKATNLLPHVVAPSSSAVTHGGGASLPGQHSTAVSATTPSSEDTGKRGASAPVSHTVTLPALAPITNTSSLPSPTHVAAQPSSPRTTTASAHISLPSVTLPLHGSLSEADEGEGRRDNRKQRLPCLQAPQEALSSATRASSLPTQSSTSVLTTGARAPALPTASSSYASAPHLKSPNHKMARTPTAPPPDPADEAYFRENNVPFLFNELSDALLEARPENPVTFMAEWLRQRREALT